MPAHMRPAKGTAQKARRARRATSKMDARQAKLVAKHRDGYQCRRCRVNLFCKYSEAAHLVDAGMGGRASVSSHPRDYVTLCHECHRGPRSLHSGHVRVEFGPDMGDGPVQFIDQQPGDRHKRTA